MKVLWITNVLFPDIVQYLGLNKNASGSWLGAAAQNLIKYCDGIELYIATPINSNELIEGKVNGIAFFALPYMCGDENVSQQIDIWKSINEKVKPDVVHIHGTEFNHGLSYIKACGKNKVVISVQGLISVIDRYMLGGVTRKDILSNLTLHEIKTRKLLCAHKRNVKRSANEKEYFSSVDYVIGRTQWDKTHVMHINPQIKYFHCDESLRTAFYENEWKLEDCEKHSIFFSQATTPLKGFHIFLKALPIVRREFPDIKIRVAGRDIFDDKDLKAILKQETYAKIINRILKANNLKDAIFFTGILDEREMLYEYLNANLFVCSSSIENSSNSISEAQILGMPCICSYVGGTPSLVEDRVTGLLYRFEEHEMLAYHIINLFNNTKYSISIGKAARNTALIRHDRKNNAMQLMEIYKAIIK